MPQIEYTNRILSSIQRGLLLEVQETGIYARRHDNCHVFASTSDPNVAHPNPQKLPKNTVVELLSFDKYVNGWFELSVLLEFCSISHFCWTSLSKH